MKPMKFTLSFILFLFPCLLFAESSVDTTPSSYKLVWSDDFSKDADGPPDPAKWKYEVGFIRNNEAQYYTKARLENARIEHGKLIIEARKEQFSNLSPKGPRRANYTSASLTTKGLKSWKYGRIEVMAMMPKGQGVWPAIWTLGANYDQVSWPLCGEIDILEMWGLQPDIIRGNFHYSLLGKHHSEGLAKRTLLSSDRTFHAYGIEWTPDRIDLLIDGVTYGFFDVNKATRGDYNPFRLPHYLLLNLAIGGSAGGTIDDTIFPQRMVVDYVRVYQKVIQ
jgi:beta-glucanase (GH16 family)